MSFVFWDTETTGMNTAFDQILQFGAIRTDHELRELERFDIRCRLLPYVVPSPRALLTNGIGVDQLTDPSLPSHYEMVRAIRARLEEWSPALFIGHNSISFDEHLLRQALYQTLHPPYLTNTHGNGRLDSLAVLRAASFLEPAVLTVPAGEKGRPTFSLDRLAPANGFAHEAAHDAMGDTEATLYLCRLVRERARGGVVELRALCPQGGRAGLCPARGGLCLRRLQLRQGLRSHGDGDRAESGARLGSVRVRPVVRPA